MRWRKLLDDAPNATLQRSSHAIAAVGDPVSLECVAHLLSSSYRSSDERAVSHPQLYLFGGEHEPRIPVDGVLYQLNMSNPSGGWTPVVSFHIAHVARHRESSA
jgi:hypothetical protein